MAEELKTVQRDAVGGPNEHKTAVNGALQDLGHELGQ